MTRNWLTDRSSLRTPIVGAPMAGVAGGRLAAAISSAGALGMIGIGSTASAEFVSCEARVAAAAGRPFGIGLMAWAPYGGRALANRFTERWHGHESALADDADAAAELATAKSTGNYDVAYIYAGQGVGSVTKERPAADVVASMTAQAEQLLDRR